MTQRHGPIFRLLLEAAPFLAYTAWLLAAESIFDGQIPPSLEFLALMACAGLAFVNPTLPRSPWPRFAAGLTITAFWWTLLFLWTFVFIYLYRGDAL